MSRSSKRPKVAVLGCGIFGALVSLELARRGAHVVVFERNIDVLQGASLNNQNRLHLGYHYPRDETTAIQCKEGFQRFRDRFSGCVSEGFPNAYFIASEGSHTNASDYRSFLERVGLAYHEIDIEEFTPTLTNVDIGVSTAETVYDSRLLAGQIAKMLCADNVQLVLSMEVEKVRRRGDTYTLYSKTECLGEFDFVVNCTYANHNKFNAELEVPSPVFQYEYTMVPIIRWGQERCGITVMDGPFMTVLPFGKSDDFLLYHVRHAVVETIVADQLPSHWLDKDASPASRIDKGALYQTTLNACTEFVQALGTAELIGFLEGPRIVVADTDDTDERRSIVANRDNEGFWSVLSGKIDHSVWVAEDVANQVFEKV